MIPYVYEVYLPDDPEPYMTMSRDYAFEAAKYNANKTNEPICIHVRIHGSARAICDLTVYPDWKEE